MLLGGGSAESRRVLRRLGPARTASREGTFGLTEGARQGGAEATPQHWRELSAPCRVQGLFDGPVGDQCWGCSETSRPHHHLRFFAQRIVVSTARQEDWGRPKLPTGFGDHSLCDELWS